MSLLPLWLPFISFVLSSVLGRRLGVNGSHIISVLLISASLVSLFILGYEYVSAGEIETNIRAYFNTGLVANDWSIKIDGLVLSLLFPVLVISTVVHLYSISYIGEDPHQQRFFSYLSLFTASIVLLVTGNSLLQLFVGWEMIGISSYLLISFWTTRLAASQSALKAFIVNRLGDVSLSIALYLFFSTFTSFVYNSSITSEAEFILIVLLLLAAIAKSAQFGFNTWLPVSMEGPTPVSALIHAATLVTAGAFLLMRVSPMLSQNVILIGLVGSLTAVFAGTVGLVQHDLKRIIAFSTCSQIGYLFLAIGLGEYSIALFHLLNHATFKALLFLSAGVVIHSINDNQDLRKIGGLFAFLPVAFICLLVGSLSLMALPYLTGFYSKEVILELAYVNYTVSGLFLYVLGVIAAGLTGYYSFRLITLLFLQTPNNRALMYVSVHSPDFVLLVPLLILFVHSVVLGYLAKDAFTGLGSSFLDSSLSLTPKLVEAEFTLDYSLKLLPLFVSLLGGFLGCILTSSKLPRQVYLFFSLKWALDDLVNQVGYKVFQWGLLTSKTLDRGLLEYLGPQGIMQLLFSMINVFVSRNVSSYGLVILASLILFIYL